MCLNRLCEDIKGPCSITPRHPAPSGGRERRVRSLIVVALSAAGLAANTATAVSAASPSPEPIVANDNTRPAGTTADQTVTVRLRAAIGAWRPEGPDGPVLTTDAFGEEGGPLTVPAPLIRVAEGTSLVVMVRNELTTPLRVHGLCSHDVGACAPLDVDPGRTEVVRLESGPPGTYHYWATSLGAPMPMRELAGAFVVDPKTGVEARDRIFVITEWNTLGASDVAQLLAAEVPGERFLAARPGLTFVINGLSWPATERLTYQRGEEVRWRVINLSSQTHPMHLHGFYFTVLATGDGRRDAPVADGEGQRVVTHLLPAGGTMRLRWTPEQEGNWLFHCHIMLHVSPARRLAGGPVPVGAPPPAHAGHAHDDHDASLGMAGMVLGITVLPAQEAVSPVSSAGSRAPRRMTMRISRTGTTPDASAIGVSIAPHDSQAEPYPSSPGPLLVLRRGEPVEITVMNEMAEPTSIHWHGLELESYYDGVHGWSGTGRRTAPMIAPGRSFIVRITPSRAGTFIYHTHLHDYRQLSSGLYGPLIVTDGEGYDPDTDHVIVLGRREASETSGILEDAASIVMNGDRMPRWMWRAGATHRIRVINITADDILAVSVVKGEAPLEWRPLTKDGAPVPDAGRRSVPARVRIGVGETYDFELDVPAGRGSLWLEVRTPGGKWQAQGHVIVR